jgi:protease I
MKSGETPLSGMRLLVFAGDAYEDLELWYPVLRMREAGAEVVIAGQQAASTCTSKHGYPVKTDVAVADVDPDAFDGVIIPGGFMPDRLRRDQHVLRIVRQIAQAGKLVAAICHGGWIPISAKVYKDVKVTGTSAIKDDLENAGAFWYDAPVVVDRHFVSSRRPDDLPDFCRAIIQVLTARGQLQEQRG